MIVNFLCPSKACFLGKSGNSVYEIGTILQSVPKMGGKNRRKWKIGEKCCLLFPVVGEETALQLSAGCLDFIAHLPSNGDTLSVLFQYGNEFTDFIHVRRIEFDMLGAVNGNQVEMAVHLPRETAQFLRIFRGCIHIFDEDVFEGDPASRGFEVVPGGPDHVFDFKVPADGKDLVPDGVVRGVEGNGQGNGQVLIGEAVNLGNDAAGGEGNIPETDV